MQRKWRRAWGRSRMVPQSAPAPRVQKSGFWQMLAKYMLPPLAAGIVLGLPGVGHALPTECVTTYGTVTFSRTANTLDANQSTLKAIVNSPDFFINANETLNIYQPSSSAAMLWKVTGSEASSIYGHINANGQLLLYNANGTYIARGAQINVGGLVATSLNIADGDFLKGNYKFTGNDSSGPVINGGVITAADGGYIALLGPEVANEGVIVAQKGTVALGAGQAVTLDMHGDKLLSLAVDQAALDAGAANHNLIQADGGQVIMTARAAKTLARAVVNNSGVIRANSVNNVNGEIILDGGPQDAVVNSGTLDAAGTAAGQRGGTVKVLGDKVTLTGTARVDVSGAAGGGTALIGGNYQGKGTEQNATTTTVEQGAVITAAATDDGDGGKVVVWANDTTVYAGNIIARGGAAGGNGGSAEVSGKKTLRYQGYTDLRAPRGRTGTLLLDPGEYTISNDATGGNVYNVTELGNQLNAANITLQTDGSGSGNITVAADLTNWTSGNTLKLQANNDINVNAVVKSSGGGNVVLRADSDADSSGTVNFGGGGKVVTDGKVSIYYNPAGTAKATVNGAEVTVKNYCNSTDYQPYVRNTAGGAGDVTAYMLVNNVTELQTVTNNLAGVYALGKDIDAGATRTWNNGTGFVPIGIHEVTEYNPTTSRYFSYIVEGQFTGIFDGDGHAVSGLYMNYDGQGTCPNTGLFNAISGGIIRNFGLKNVSISGRTLAGYVGGLAGTLSSGSITNCYVTGMVSGTNANSVGGLVGTMTDGRISNSFSAATVQGANDYIVQVGGLVGMMGSGVLDACYTAGSITGSVLDPNANADSCAGGLVGYNNGKIVNSYSTATVAGPLYAGGLVGWNGSIGSIENSYNTGKVMGSNFVGGLVGRNDGKITGSYNAGAINGIRAGGLAGSLDAGGQIADSYSVGEVTGICIGGGLVGMLSEGGVITGSYSAGKVSGGMAGGFVGYADNVGGISGSFWDMDTSGQTTGIGSGDGSSIAGLTGLSAAEHDPYSKGSYNGFDFAKTWYMADGATRPFLAWEYSTTITNAHQLQLMVKDLGAHYTLAGNIDMHGFNMARSGFVPVGSSSTPFTGTFDGRGYAVNGLTINTPVSGAVGLFGYLKNATVRSVGLYDAQISGGAGSSYVGSLAGYNDGGSITNVYSTGSVGGLGAVGGLVGYNGGTITAAYSTSQVNTGDGGKAGGLAGENNGRITGAYSTGPVSGGSGATIGGFVGANGSNGTVENSCWDQETSGQTGGLGSGSAAGLAALTTAQMMNKAYMAGLGFDFTKTWFMLDGATRPFLRSENVDGISNAHQLQLMAANLHGDYILNNDIGMSELGSAAGMWNTTAGFAPVGSSDAPFTGVLNGAGHTVDGLVIKKSASAAVGLFGYIKDAAISAIGLRDVSITGGAGNLYVGGLAGENENGCIMDTYVTGMVSGETNTGGLVGLNKGTVMRSYNAGMVNGIGNLGGVAGINAGMIDQSYNRGTVETFAGGGVGSKAGGLTGLNTGHITGSYNAGADWSGNAAGTVNGNATGDVVGGLAGENAGDISGSYNAGIVNANASGSEAGGLAGINTGNINDSYNAAADWMIGPNAGTVNGNNVQTIVGGLVGENAGTIGGSYNAGDVIAYFEQSIAGGLAGINKKIITGSYNNNYLNNNAAGNILGGLAGENYGTITGDSYNAGTIYVNAAGGVTGGVTGINHGSVTKAYNKGELYSYATGATGGVAGKNYGSITKSYNTGTLISYATGNILGGLAGENMAGGSIGQSYNTGNVTAEAADNSIGGVAGKNAGDITGAYNQAVITAKGAGSRVGGLTGWNAAGGRVANCWNSTFMIKSDGEQSSAGGVAGQNDGDIAYCFAVTPLTVSGTGSQAGALVGVNNGTISHGFWNTEIAGLAKGVGAGDAQGVAGKTIAEMMQSGTYAGWDLANTWHIVAGASFPYLTWQFAGAPQFISGLVHGGGSGKNINIRIYDTGEWFHEAKNEVGQLQLSTVAANGFYYMTVPSSITVPDNALLLYYVADDSGNFKANALYRYGSNGVMNGDLRKDTLIVNGGDYPVSDIPAVPTAYSLYSSTNKQDAAGDLHPYLTVNGDLQAYNFLCSTEYFRYYPGCFRPPSFSGLTATGSITIINPASKYVFLKWIDSKYNGGIVLTRFSDVDEIRTPITAGGDITYVSGRNLLISSGGQLTAGGNITLVTDSGFLNNAGTDVFKLTGGGRWLVYASDRLINQSSRLFYEQPLYASILKNHNEMWREYFQNYLPGTERVCDGQGGLTGDFTQWGTYYGGAVPAAGNGFVYAALQPVFRPSTPQQTHCDAAITAAQTYQAKGRAALPEITEKPLPFLTVIGKGVAGEAAGPGQVTAEQPAKDDGKTATDKEEK